ncbi:bifunctional adenosylcobinamide kinase/adenosylcobinamide-phosphate guanylyltransferase [Virgibacillus sp. YIM 98842]|jgi:adenosyl cobinamide kinase/adenosyl cobinamide phosphate guanylyltransferase|uniref:bifunctional adenosylcobinamide kinase/adenosylcobinamide-phosphate guanylyltransferase n=1 Tax=Virgibacillus sp. YIM 98842 TaxID=2663533 RepID=UPI0013DA65A9|nr:bifunctional adenosylcobinamide kinase/adenosylcobinamide-phosphate guanylyltransferase [Virgibacillus sp. YIM 98842]
MHVITGGACNGKADWVKRTYGLSNQSHIWISAYEKEPCPINLAKYDTRFIVLEGAEQWIRQIIENQAGEYNRDDGRALIKKWLKWERKNPVHQLIIIGTDISKGIVPIQQLDRTWRDATGWFYQDLVKESDRFDVIWYGINNQLKGEE